MTFSMGRKWDLTSCTAFSATTSSFDFTAWPQGDRTNANDYSTFPDCTESSATCAAEMVAAVTDMGSGSYNITHDWYDPYGRKVYSYSSGSATWIVSWVGRFGEKNLDLEVYKPGMYKVIETVDGTPTTYYFDIYSQATQKYLSVNGNNNGSGNSWGAAKSTWAAAQTALSAGNTMNIMAGNYSSESGFSFSKSQSLAFSNTFGGYPNTVDTTVSGPADSGSNTFFCVSNPIEADGTIDRWAFYSLGRAEQNVKLKIYRGGDAGTVNKSASTLIYTSDVQSNIIDTDWVTFSIASPVSVQRGDILAIHTTSAYLNVGLKSVTTASGIASCAYESGDPSNTTIGSSSYSGYDIMLRAWKSGSITTQLPKTS